MKFTDGYWRKRDGFAVLHPAAASETTARRNIKVFRIGRL